MQPDAFVKLEMEQNKCLLAFSPCNIPPVTLTVASFVLYKLEESRVLLLAESLVTGRFSPAQVRGRGPCTLEISGLEIHVSGADTLAGLSLTHGSLWYLKKRPLMDLNLFILAFKKSAPSKERSGCVYNKMKPPTWTIHTCTGVKQKRLLPPTWFSLRAKAKEDGRDTAGLTLHPSGVQTQLG